MAEFSFGFTKGSFLQLNGQKHLRSVAEVINKKEPNEFIKNGEGTGIIKIGSHDPIFSSNYSSAHF